EEGNGGSDQPATYEDALPPEAIGEPAREIVRERLRDAEDGDERQDRGACGEMEFVLRDRRQDGAFHPDHRADERVHHDEQRWSGWSAPSCLRSRRTNSISPHAPRS